MRQAQEPPPAFRWCILGCILFCAAGAQGQAAAQHSARIVAEAEPRSGCPLALRAEQAVAGETMAVTGSGPHGAQQRLRITVDGPESMGLREARVVVLGLTSQPRTLPAAADPVTADSRTGGEATRGFDLRFHRTAFGPTQAIADLIVDGFTAIERIDFVSLTYARGMPQSPSAVSGCRVTPEGWMLLSLR